ncbi:MAG: flagellar motor switch protein FliM [Candidatus Delongbacteria bacterium]|nr:flagellar motor switch protein FliM [Candidatus Delongbacteria bacterium]
MSGKLLSQDEIESLLETIGKPKLKLRKAVVQPFDFKHPDRIVKDQLRSLHNIHEQFGRSFGTSLSSSLRAMVEINLVTINQLTYSEYTTSLAEPTCLIVLNVNNEEEDLSGSLTVEMEPQFVLFCVDRLLGGTGDVLAEPRDITIIEQSIIRRLLESMVTGLNEVWDPTMELNLSYETMATNPQSVQIAPAGETIALLSFRISVMDRHFPLRICIPYYILEPLLPLLVHRGRTGSGNKEPTLVDQEAVLARVNSSLMSIEVRLGRTRVSVGGLLALEKGDVLVLDRRLHDPLEVFINGEVKFLGVPGKIKRHRAVKLIHQIGREDKFIYSDD